MKKKLLILSFVLALAFLISGCTISTLTVKGFENVRWETSSIGTTSHMLPRNPNDQYDFSYNYFIELFETKAKNAVFHSEETSEYSHIELVIFNIQFAELSYDKAKKYILNDFDCENNIFAQKGNYLFYSVSQSEKNSSFAKFICFDDTTKTFLSFGSYMDGDKYNGLSTITVDNFNEYLSLFSKYYDFSKE